VIITRSPLRITLGGGGTDLPSYYERHGGFLIAAAIDRYVYITIHDNFSDDLIVKYSRLERVPSAECVEHPLIRESLGLLGLDALDGDQQHGGHSGRYGPRFVGQFHHRLAEGTAYL
jgi:D-glycero-alpha-D-manno-heptose-7-phosphate kinase